MQYFVHHNGQQLGPFSEAELKAKLASGEIAPADHVWWQGQQGWVPLNQTQLVGPTEGTTTMAPPVVPGTPAAAAYMPETTAGPTSQLAIWALVCGCASILCGLLASIAAIILGHLGLSEIKKNPALKGRGMAMAGTILGYVFTSLWVIYLIVVFTTLGSLQKQVKETFDTITSQLNSAEAASTNSDNSSGDQTTNSAPATNNAPANQ